MAVLCYMSTDQLHAHGLNHGALRCSGEPTGVDAISGAALGRKLRAEATPSRSGTVNVDATGTRADATGAGSEVATDASGDAELSGVGGNAAGELRGDGRGKD
eukprot:8849279-Pyramimonas_sp.AAC.1